MNETAEKCLQQLLKTTQFHRLNFLQLLAQMQTLLAYYALYHFIHRNDQTASLQCIQQAVESRSDSIAAAMALAVKAAVLSHSDQHTQSVKSFKESVEIVKKIGANSIPISSLETASFPRFMARVLQVLNLRRGRREFLMAMDEIRTMLQGRPQMAIIDRAILTRMDQLRNNMRCHGKSQQQKRILHTSKSAGMFNSFDSDHSETQSTTSIYISRLYEERRKNLGKREGSDLKKSHSGLKREASSGRGRDPYQLKISKNARNESGDCFPM